MDTVDTLQAMKVDYIVVRHKASGVPAMIAKHTNASVVNAGDGFHAHPTQALLDAFTAKEIFDDLRKRKILIVGDVLHSRVARSVSTCMHKLGVEVAMFGPGTLVPKQHPQFIKTFPSFDEALKWKPDIVYLLRLQRERQAGNFLPSMYEYHNHFGITRERFKHIQGEGITIMHPGPVNRGVELIDDVMTYERCTINQQVENGIATRMAVLYSLQPQTKTRSEDAEGITA